MSEIIQNKPLDTEITLLALTGLSCMKCVGRVQTALLALPNVLNAEVTLHYAKISHHGQSLASLIECIGNAGYHATLANRPDITLKLGGLSCGHCIQSVTKIIHSEEGVIFAEITLDHANIYGDISEPESLIKRIQAADFEAELSSPQAVSYPKIDPLPDSPFANLVTDNQDSSRQNREISSTEESLQTTQLLVEGLSCASCVNKVQRALENVKGVEKANVNLAERSALVTGSASTEALIDAVVNAGYQAEVVIDEQQRRLKQLHTMQTTVKRYRWQAALSLVLAIPLMLWGMFVGNMVVTPTNQAGWLIIGIITLIIMIIAGKHFYLNAWKNLRQRSTTMDTLVALGTGVAWIYSFTVTLFPHFFPENARHLYYEASVMIIGLINLGHAIEAKARHHSSKAIERLLDLTPPTARLINDKGKETIVPIAQIHTGMTLRLAAGDRVPVDGHIIQGDIWLDESMLTGEAHLQHKEVDDIVRAGTVVENGTVLFIANAIGQQTTLARIIQLVRQAQSSKPQMGKMVDKVAAVFVPTVIIIAIISGLIWFYFGPSPQLAYSFVIITTVLIIACPCALGLAAPMSIIAGVGKAAELGALIKDADALEKGSQVNTIVFDKTGTLTEGKPKVTEVLCYSTYHQTDIAQFATALEQGANHPLANAILAYTQPQLNNASPLTLNNYKTLRGYGVSAQYQHQSLLLGNDKLMSEFTIDLHPYSALIDDKRQAGATLVFLAIEQQLAAIFVIEDTLREDSVHAIRSFHQQGYQLVMLTGDHQTTAQYIAQKLGIEHVIANVLPDGKADVIRSLQQQGNIVAMIGDGINDAPALAQADVSIAMGGGSDIAIETAAITLMRQSLTCANDALQLAKATLRNMKQSLFGAFIYNICGIPIAAGILYPLIGVLLNPMIAGAAMALSSITVVTNANRLLHFKPKRDKD